MAQSIDHLKAKMSVPDGKYRPCPLILMHNIGSVVPILQIANITDNDILVLNMAYTYPIPIFGK